MSRYTIAPGAVDGMGRKPPDLGEGMRSFPVRNYRIYYRQDSRGQVRILRVKHTARDESTLFR